MIRNTATIAACDPLDRVSTTTLARKLRKVGGRTPLTNRPDSAAPAPDHIARQELLGLMDRACDAGLAASLRFACDLCAPIVDQDVVLASAIIRHGATLAGLAEPGQATAPEDVLRLVRHVAGPDLPACIDLACRILSAHPDPRAGVAGVVLVRAAYRASLPIADATIDAIMGPAHPALPFLHARKTP